MDKDIERVQTTVEFIKTVKLEKAIYDFSDPDYKNAENKMLAWQRVAMQTNMTVDASKRKWKNLRDSYTKYLKALRTKSASNSRKYQSWAHAQVMSFLRPFQGPSRTRKMDDFEDNIQVLNASDYEGFTFPDEDQKSIMDLSFYEKTPSNECVPPQNDSLDQTRTYYSGPDPGEPNESADDTQHYSDDFVLNGNYYTNYETASRDKLMQNNRKEFSDTNSNQTKPNKKISLRATDLDSTSLFFLSLAKSVRKMPTKYQARIKVQCLQIVTEMESTLDDLEGQQSRTKNFSKTSNTSNVSQTNERQTEHFTYEMSPSNVEAMIEITSSDDESAIDSRIN